MPPQTDTMIILGLTGSIGMGKTTAANMLRALGVPVHDADAAVHKMMAPGGRAVPMIVSAFPDACADGVVDRKRLSAKIASDPSLLPRLEAILHPLVHEEEERFLADCRKNGARIVALDIPLLFETEGEKCVHQVIVVSAPLATQQERVFARPDMTEEKFKAILARQCPDKTKRKLADFVVETGKGLAHTEDALRKIVTALKTLDASHIGCLRPKSLNVERCPPCGKSSSTPKPRGSTRNRGTGSSKSAALN